MIPRKKKMSQDVRKLTVVDERQSESDLEYWLSRTAEERVSAIEILRQQWHKMRNERPERLRRIIRIIKSGKS